MHAHHVNARLAAHASIRQLRVNDQAEAAGGAADLAVAHLWQQFLELLRHDYGFHQNYARAAAIFRQVPHAIVGSLWDSFTRLFRAGHQSAADATVDVLPRASLKPLLARAGASSIAARFAEALQEEEHPLTPAGFRFFGDEDDPAELETEPIFPAVGEDGLREMLRDVLFPPPPEGDVRHFLAPLVRPFDWMTIGGAAARKVPEDLATRYAQLVSQGLSRREIAGEVQPFLDGSRVRARRFARTFGQHVAHQAQLAADEGLGDLLDGYQIRAVMDEHTRSWHAHRSGTVYYKNPGAGQLGFDHMPQPPKESPDPSDRPPGTSEIAFNCRCYLTPVLAPLDGLEHDPVFADNEGQLIPDPHTYSDWWNRKATPRERRLAVGVRRWDAVRQRTPRPRWEDFLDPQRGTLLSVDRLRGESRERRLERVRKVKGLVAHRRELTRQVSVFGFTQGGSGPTGPLVRRWPRQRV